MDSATDGWPPSWDGHLLLVHHNEQQRRTGVAAWARRGLDLGAKVLYIEAPAEPAERAFTAVLGEHGVDAAGAAGRGQLEVFPANDSHYSPTWQASVVEDTLADGYPAVFWSGEAFTAWDAMSPSTHAAIEWTTDELCRERPVSVLCQYPGTLTQATLQTVCAQHGDGMREALMHTSPIPNGIALAGEVDRSNERLLRAALVAAAATTATDGRTLVIDLRHVGFLDVAGARALLTGTTTHRLGGGAVRLQAPQRHVERTLRLLGVHDMNGFTLEEGS